MRCTNGQEIVYSALLQVCLQLVKCHLVASLHHSPLETTENGTKSYSVRKHFQALGSLHSAMPTPAAPSGTSLLCVTGRLAKQGSQERSLPHSSCRLYTPVVHRYYRIVSSSSAHVRGWVVEGREEGEEEGKREERE